MRAHSSRLLLPALVALPVLLAGCSSGNTATKAAGSPAPGSSSAATSSSAAPTSDAQDVDAQRKETFCTEVPGLLRDLTSNLNEVGSDPTKVKPALDDAVARISAVQPPAEASAQWGDLVSAWTDLRDLLAQADVNNPSANASLAPQLQALQGRLVGSGSAVDDYGKANC